jgi:DNA-binding transcriptional MerR regulator
MDKTTEAFRTIGEVAEELDLPQHVLRFWETKFTQIRPVKRAGGRRYYRPDDVHLVAAIRVLLYSDGYTIKGVQRILKEQGSRAVISTSSGPRSVGPTGVAAGEAKLDAPVRICRSPASPAAPLPGAPLASSSAPCGMTRLSTQDRHRLEAILAELTECARLLA